MKGSQPMNKLSFRGVIISIQPRIRLTRSFDEAFHTYLGYAIRITGTIDNQQTTFSIDIDKIDYATYQKIYEISIQNYKKKEDDGSGGNHYNTKKSNLSETFAKAVINSTLEGQLLHDEAFRLLNVSHSTAFNKLMEMYNL
jgi:hypothetical protein